MSIHNYTQYANKRPENSEPVVMDRPSFELEPVTPEVEVPEVEATEVKMVEETVETVTLPETVTGTVIGCTKLNVREEPDITANVVCVLNAKTEVEINVEKTTSEWVSVCTAAGIEGYCMRKFIDARL